MSEGNTVDSAYSTASEAEPESGPHRKALRWWPALVIIVGMVALKFTANLFEAPPLPVLILSFMGPGILGFAIPLWWLAASRAPWRERLIGLAGLTAIGVVTVLATHVSMKGMGTMISSFLLAS